MLQVLDRYMTTACPFAAVGFSLLAAFAGLSTLLFNTKRFFQTGLPDSDKLPRGVEKDGNGNLWFRELSDFWQGQCISLQIDRVIYSGHTGLQHILVFESARYGIVMALDGAIQLTTLDESAYQEVMAHTPMHLCKTGSVKRALVIGGGDGGVLRELGKYPEIEEIHICEIDGEVINTCKRFIPQTAVGFEDSRVHVHIEDGFLFLERMIKEGITFDVIVSDLSDPIGPAESVFNESFLELLYKTLEPRHGVAALQAESYWLHGDLTRRLFKEARSYFPQVGYASISIPTYPCGQIGCLIMCVNESANPSVIVRDDGIDQAKLQYYTRDLHSALFVLPKMMQHIVSE